MSVPRFLAEPEEQGTAAKTFVGLGFKEKLVLICVTRYAGEIKDSAFTVVNFVLLLDVADMALILLARDLDPTPETLENNWCKHDEVAIFVKKRLGYESPILLIKVANFDFPRWRIEGRPGFREQQTERRTFIYRQGQRREVSRNGPHTLTERCGLETEKDRHRSVISLILAGY